MHGRRPSIRIAKADGESGRYIASFQSDLLGATYAVVFRESVTGAVALHRFAGMIESQYGKPVELRVDTDLIPFGNKAVEDILRSIAVTEPVLR